MNILERVVDLIAGGAHPNTLLAFSRESGHEARMMAAGEQHQPQSVDDLVLEITILHQMIALGGLPLPHLVQAGQQLLTCSQLLQGRSQLELLQSARTWAIAFHAWSMTGGAPVAEANPSPYWKQMGSARVPQPYVEGWELPGKSHKAVATEMHVLHRPPIWMVEERDSRAHYKSHYTKVPTKEEAQDLAEHHLAQIRTPAGLVETQLTPPSPAQKIRIQLNFSTDPHIEEAWNCEAVKLEIPWQATMAYEDGRLSKFGAIEMTVRNANAFASRYRAVLNQRWEELMFVLDQEAYFTLRSEVAKKLFDSDPPKTMKNAYRLLNLKLVKLGV